MSPANVPAVSDEPTVEYREITLADVVRVFQRRKWVFLAVLVLFVLGGVVFTVLQPAQYESKATLVPLEQLDIMKNWFESRHAAELVVGDLGTRLGPALFADRWDSGAGTWSGVAPTLEEQGQALTKHVTATLTRVALGERLLEVTVELPDPVLARDVAASYMGTLDELRPSLENITRQQAFAEYYDGKNELEAQRQAEVTARQWTYWIMLDEANLPEAPSSPNRVLNIALAGIVGILGGIFAVFVFEWGSKFRAEQRSFKVSEPPSPETPVDVREHPSRFGPRLRPPS